MGYCYYLTNKKLFKEAYLSCSISKKDTDTDITIDNNDLTDIKRMFVTYKAFKVSFFLNIFLTILIMLFKLLLLYLGILNLEIFPKKIRLQFIHMRLNSIITRINIIVTGKLLF